MMPPRSYGGATKNRQKDAKIPCKTLPRSFTALKLAVNCKQALTRPQPDTDRLETPGTLPSGEQAPSPTSGVMTNVTSSEMLSVTLALWPTAAYPITRELFGICKWLYLLLFRFPCRV